jgi:signal transduction histidine kinase
MKKIFYWLGSFLFLMILNSCSHLKTGDLNKMKSDVILMDSIKKLDSLSETNWINHDSLSIIYARTALNLSKSLSSPERLIKAYHTIGKAYYPEHKDSSFYYYSKSLALTDSLKSLSEKPSLLYNIAMLNFDAGNFNASLSLLDSCVSSAKRGLNFPVLSNAFNSMGNIYMEIHDSIHAKESFKKALQVGEENSLTEQTGNAMDNLALFENEVARKISLQKQAILYLQKAPGTAKEIANTLINIGAEQIKPDSAIDYYNRALNESKNKKFLSAELAAYNNLTYSYLDLGNIIKANKCVVDKAIPLAKEINNLDWLANIYDTYTDVLSAKGENKKALLTLRLSLKYKDQYNSKKNEQQVRLLAAMLDLKNKESTIKEKETEIKTTNIQNLFLKLVVAIALLVIVIIIIIYNGFRQRMKIKFKQQQINSARRIIELEETEKSRIGFELHDNLGYLVRVTDGFINSLTVEDQRIKDQLTDKMRELIDCIRRISHRVNLLKDDQSKLQDIIPDIINDMRTFTGINVSYFIPVHLPDFPREIILHVSRIVQELLTNAGKYARNSKIRFDVAFIDNNLHLLYKDDGPGFDPLKISDEGIGLSSIYERIILLGGKATLDSSPGNGTKWEISVPLH